jgi:hypothetical protein
VANFKSTGQYSPRKRSKTACPKSDACPTDQEYNQNGGCEQVGTYADSENGERGLVQTSQIHHDYGNGGKMYEVSI